MSHWNYRVMRKAYHVDEVFNTIHEVHYDDAGNVTGWSEGPAVVTVNVSMNETIEQELEKFKQATTMPVLDFETGKEIN